MTKPKLKEYKLFIYGDRNVPQSLTISRKVRLHFVIRRKVLWGLMWTEIDSGPIEDEYLLIDQLEIIKSQERASIDISEAKEYLRDHLTLTEESIYL
jgi:hypothetical protein